MHTCKTHTWQSSSDTPLNIRMQSLRKPSIETQNYRCLQRFQREERKPGWKKKGEEAWKGAKDVSCHLQIPRRYRTLPWASREGRTGTRPYQKSKPEFEFCAKRRWSVSNPQLRLRPFDQIPASRTGGLERRGRLGRVKERKERGKGREVSKVSCSLPVGALWPVVRVRRRPGAKGSQLRPLGLVHWQASWPLSTPSGQDVSLSKEESHQSRHLL